MKDGFIGFSVKNLSTFRKIYASETGSVINRRSCEIITSLVNVMSLLFLLTSYFYSSNPSCESMFISDLGKLLFDQPLSLLPIDSDSSFNKSLYFLSCLGNVVLVILTLFSSDESDQ